MSQESVEVVKRGIEAYWRGDIDAVLDELDEGSNSTSPKSAVPTAACIEDATAFAVFSNPFWGAWASITPVAANTSRLATKLYSPPVPAFRPKAAASRSPEAAWAVSSPCVTA